MGSNERRSVQARREDLSPVCKALYQMAFADLAKVLHPSTRGSSPGLLTNMWNRLKSGSSQRGRVTDVNQILTGIMDQIEALDQALKENPSGIRNLLMFLADIKVPEGDISISNTQTDASMSNKEAFSKKLAHALAVDLHRLAQTQQFDIDDPKLAILLQLLIDVCNKPTSTIASMPVLNFVTENSNAVKNWHAESLNELLTQIPEKGIDNLADKLDDSGENELLLRMLSWRYEANSPQTGVLEMGDKDDSQTSKFVKLIETLNQVTELNISSDESKNVTVSLSYSPNFSTTENIKDEAQKQLLSVAQLISGEDSEQGPDDTHKFRVIST